MISLLYENFLSDISRMQETFLSGTFLKETFPSETFPNLILLYCKYQHYDLAADILAENAHLTYKCLS